MPEAETSVPQKRFSEQTLKEAERKRSQHRVVKRYLEALAYGQGPPQENPGHLQDQIDQLVVEIESAEVVERLRLIQRRLDLEARLAAVTGQGASCRFEELEEEFVEVAAEWAERGGFTYSALRETGVPAAALRRAGIARAKLS